MDGTISYLNTDLDLISSDELTALAAVLESRGVFPLHVTHRDDGLWYATFEMQDQHTEPEPNIAAMVAVVESLGEPHRAIWLGCTRREFNIGYDCGTEPWAFTRGCRVGCWVALPPWAHRCESRCTRTASKARPASRCT